MGAKFTNIHISITCQHTLDGLLQTGETALRLSEDWISVLNDTLDYKKNKSRARSLSKRLPGLLIYTEYFDDDVAEITVLREGIKRCGYLNNEGQKYILKPSAWETELGLDKEDMKALRLIAKTGAGPSFDLSRISALIGAPLDVDSNIPDDGRGLPLYARDKSATKEFIRQQAKLRAIKNKTKLSLLYEQAGQYLYGKTANDNCVLQMLLSKEGKYDLRHVHCFSVEADQLSPYYDFVRPEQFFPPGSTRLQEMWLNADQLQVMAFYQWVFISAENKVDGNAYEAELYGNQRAMLSTKPAWLMEPFRFIVRAESQGLVLKKIAQDQTVLTSRILPDSLHMMDEPVLADDRLICFCRDRNSSAWETLIYDLELNLLERKKLDSCPDQGIGYQKLYSRHHHSIFLCQYDGEVTRYDLKTHTLRSTRMEGGTPHLWGFDHLHHLLYSPSWGTFYVVDDDLKVLSRHRIKGELKFFYTANSGQTRVISADQYIESDQVPAKEPKVYVYELQYAD